MTQDQRGAAEDAVSEITLREAADRYDVFFIDVWGVLHDGKKPYPGAAEALRYLTVGRGKVTVLLTNAPRSRLMVRRRMREMGFGDSDYTALVSSGETSRRMLERGEFVAPGPRYYLLGGRVDGDVLAGLKGFLRVKREDEADFLFVTGYGERFPDRAAVAPVLARALARGLPMLSANPDMIVTTIQGEIEPCAGDIVAFYREMGGFAREAGKPHPEIYATARELYAPGASASAVLCVGDNPATDIAGARRAGFDSLLILSGVSALPGVESPREARPTYTAGAFRLF